MTEWFFGIKIKALKMTVMTVWCCQTILFQSKNNGKKVFLLFGKSKENWKNNDTAAREKKRQPKNKSKGKFSL